MRDGWQDGADTSRTVQKPSSPRPSSSSDFEHVRPVLPVQSLAQGKEGINFRYDPKAIRCDLLSDIYLVLVLDKPPTGCSTKQARLTQPTVHHGETREQTNTTGGLDRCTDKYANKDEHLTNASGDEAGEAER
jgi:hypothetical protein